MAKNVGFEFPLDLAQQWDGFNDSGMEHFSGSPFEHLGREAVQNILDAYHTYPVRVEIQLKEVETESIPDLDGLKATIKSCLKGAKDEGKKAHQFFEYAAELLKKPRIKVLQIADYNTKGVVGPCENGKPFFAMMKATGQSKKASETATGSFGIGKFAPFTVSGLRTIFVSTIWQDEKKKSWHQYVQGKSILMSHQDGAKTRRGTGFWGKTNKCLPVEDAKGLPDWLVRSANEKKYSSARGTTLSILGFEAIKDWNSILAANIAENFFGAIQSGKLEVFIGEDIAITSDTLHALFDSEEISGSLSDQKNEPEKFNNAREYLKTLSRNKEVLIEHTENFHLGRCELRLIVGEGLPKRVAFLRNGMLITDRLNGLMRLGEFKEFVAVLECKSSKGNELLRAMEPPRHDDFEPDRLLGKDRKQGKVALAELARWVKDMLKRHAQNPVSEVTNIDELADFFGDEEVEGIGKQRNEKNPEGGIVIRARALPPSRIEIAPFTDQPKNDMSAEQAAAQSVLSSISAQASGSGGHVDPSSGSAPQQFSSGGGSLPGANSNRGPAIIDLLNVRAIPIGEKKRRLIFTPKTSGSLVIEVQDSGADGNYPLKVIASSEGKIREDGKVEAVAAVGGQRCTIEIELDKHFDGTMRMVANAV